MAGIVEYIKGAIRQYENRLEIDVAIHDPTYTDQAIIKIMNELYDSTDKKNWTACTRYNRLATKALRERKALRGNIHESIPLML